NHGVAVAAEYHRLDVFHRDVQRLGEEAPVAGGIEDAGHADHALPGEPGDFLGHPAHDVERVGDHDHGCLRRMLLDLLALRLHDFHVGPDQVVAAHAGLPGDARGHDEEVTPRGGRVVVGPYHSAGKPL